MTSIVTRIAAFDKLRVLASGSITTSYVKVGSALSFPARIVKFTNTTSLNLRISTDGSNDYDIEPAGTGTVYDVTAAKSVEILGVPQGTQFWVKSESGTTMTGNFYITVIYGATNNSNEPI